MIQRLPEDIRTVLAMLSAIPYENLSKAVDYNFNRLEESDLMERPEGLISRHKEQGTGGTCFALTWYLCSHLRGKGYDIYPVLCDRAYGKNTHCCAVLVYKGERYLLDPGYLSFSPLRLDINTPSTIETVFNSIEVVPDNPNCFRLNTIYLKEKKYRFTLKDEFVGDNDFFRHWRESFKWESLTYPVVTMLKGDAHLYFQKQSLYVRRKTGSEKINILPEKLPETLDKYFGIKPALTIKALDVFY